MTDREWLDKWFALDITSPELESAAMATRAWCIACARNKRDAQRLLVIYGSSGTGKTHLAKRAMAFLRAAASYAWEHRHWDRPLDLHFTAWPQLVAEVTSENATRSSWAYTCTTASALILDDIGAEVDRYRNGMAAAILRDTLDQRAGRWTLVTTNIAPDAWTATWDARCADRLLRNSNIISLTRTPSYSLFKRTLKPEDVI